MILGGSGNAVRGNSIHDNGFGISLYYGANNGQVPPTVVLAVAEGPLTKVNTTLQAAPNTSYILDFFASNALDPDGNAEGQTFLGSATVTTNAQGNGDFWSTVSGMSYSGQLITATATDPSGDTSQFSNPQTVTVLGVTNTNDSGPGSLRYAIEEAETLPAPNLITFQIASGPQTIQLFSPLAYDHRYRDHRRHHPARIQRNASDRPRRYLCWRRRAAWSSKATTASFAVWTSPASRGRVS